MDKFSKFLYPSEALRLVIYSRGKKSGIIWAIILLVLDFFIMFPSIKIGENGLFLWVVLTASLFIFLLKQLLQKNTTYLLTSNRLLCLPSFASEARRARGSIRLDQIERMQKSGKHHICLIVSGRKYFLFNIKNRDRIYQKMQNLV